MIHQSVLRDEAIAHLKLTASSTVIDGTINGGGHSEAICSILGRRGHLLGVDLDADALVRAKERLHACTAEVTLREGSFADMEKLAKSAGISCAQGILLDLGLSSNQLEESGRGFSFMRDEPLLMTFKKQPTEHDFTAEDIVNEWGEGVIADILYGYGEERYARKIARAIVEGRKRKRIKTTHELLTTIRDAMPKAYQNRRVHYATKTFQALRIAVNGELIALTKGLTAALNLVCSNGRIVVISFHSLEDREVKRAFAQAQQEGRGRVVTRKPITPSPEELKRNPRARSAKLRVFERT